MMITVGVKLPRGGSPENGIPSELTMRGASVSEWKSIVSSSSKTYKYRALWNLCDQTSGYNKDIEIENFLHPIDITVLMFYARIATLGPNVGIDAICPLCGDKNSITVDLSTIEFTEFDGENEREIEIEYQPANGEKEKIAVTVRAVREADSMKIYKLAERILAERKKREKKYDLSIIDVISELLPFYRISMVNGAKTSYEHFLLKYPNLDMISYNKISDVGDELDNKVDMKPIKHICTGCDEEFEIELPRGREVLLYKHTGQSGTGTEGA